VSTPEDQLKSIAQVVGKISGSVLLARTEKAIEVPSLVDEDE